MNTALEYSTRMVQEGDRRCKKSTLNDLAYLTPLRIPLMNPVNGHLLRFLRAQVYAICNIFFLLRNFIDIPINGTYNEADRRLVTSSWHVNSKDAFKL